MTWEPSVTHRTASAKQGDAGHQRMNRQVTQLVRGHTLPRERAGVVLHYVDDDVGVGTARDVYVVVWRKRTTVEAVARAKAVFDTFAATKGRELANIAIVEANGKMPEPAAREALAAFLASARDKTVISALVFEGRGFVAASIRGVVVGLTLIARQPYPHRVFSSVDEAASWFADEEKRIGKPFSPDTIVKDVMNLRQLMSRSSGA